MALQRSGAISMSDIRAELGNGSSSQGLSQALFEFGDAPYPNEMRECYGAEGAQKGTGNAWYRLDRWRTRNVFKRSYDVEIRVFNGSVVRAYNPGTLYWRIYNGSDTLQDNGSFSTVSVSTGSFYVYGTFQALIGTTPSPDHYMTISFNGSTYSNPGVLWGGQLPI
jgi:hypothetical protein